MRSRPARLLVLVAIIWRVTCAVDAQQPSTPSLSNTNWMLWKFEERGGSVLEPEDRTKYTLRFGDQLEAQLDCNKLQSTWKATGAEFRFGKLEGPRLKCAAGSIADRMVHDWTGIRSYSVRSTAQPRLCREPCAGSATKIRRSSGVAAWNIFVTDHGR